MVGAGSITATVARRGDANGERGGRGLRGGRARGRRRAARRRTRGAGSPPSSAAARGSAGGQPPAARRKSRCTARAAHAAPWNAERRMRGAAVAIAESARPARGGGLDDAVCVTGAGGSVDDGSGPHRMPPAPGRSRGARRHDLDARLERGEPRRRRVRSQGQPPARGARRRQRGRRAPPPARVRAPRRRRRRSQAAAFSAWRTARAPCDVERDDDVVALAEDPRDPAGAQPARPVLDEHAHAVGPGAARSTRGKSSVRSACPVSASAAASARRMEPGAGRVRVEAHARHVGASRGGGARATRRGSPRASGQCAAMS